MLAAALITVLAQTPCCTTPQQCIERLRSIEASDAPSPRPLRRSCESAFLETVGVQFVPEVIKLLSHRSWEARDAAAAAIGAMKPLPSGALPALHALARRDPDGWAAWALEQIRDVSSAPVMVSLAARGRSLNELEDPLWSASVPLAIDALPSADWAGRSRLFQIISSHRDRSRPSSEALRLHELLKAELRKPSWPTPECKGRESWVDAPRMNYERAFDACLPAAGAIVAALDRYGVAAGFAADAIERAGRRSPYVQPFSANALVEIGAESAERRMALELRSADPEVVLGGLMDVLKTPDAGTLLEAVERVVARPEPGLSSMAVMVLAFRGTAVSNEVLRAGLRSRRIVDVVTTLTAIRALGPRAVEVEGEVTALLSSPVISIQREAALAVSAISGRKVIAKPPKCFTGPKLTPIKDLGEKWDSHPAQGAWLRAVDHGEFGGSISVVLPDAGLRQLQEHINPQLVVDIGASRVMVQGLAHMSMREGSVWRIDERDGGVSLEFITDTLGYPVGYAVKGDVLTLEVKGGDQDCTYLFPVQIPSPR